MNIKIYTIIKIYLLLIFCFQYRKLANFILLNKTLSKSQIFQDLVCLHLLNYKKKGTFIEVGGGNGVDLSNTYLLEKKYNWKGVICEPDKRSQKKIRKNRHAKLEVKPITNKCGKQIYFYEEEDPYLSSIKKGKNKISSYKSNTICLNHLISKYKIGNIIDYISIDTEGNEFEILKKFNFKKYNVNFFTIEHNFNLVKRKKIKQIMKKNKFKQVYKFLSYMDDWYINTNIK